MLYIVATPIGNLSEISYRAVEVLNSVSLIAAEDTRKSAVLLRHYSIKTPMISYQKFNERELSATLVKRMMGGEDIAIISDAGMPLVSDPGHILVSECIKAGVEITVISGPCAAVNSFVLSGFKPPFCVMGFLPDKTIDREKLILDYVFCPAALVFYSPPQSVYKDLEFLHKKLGVRRFVALRELTKKFETIYRGELGSALPQINLKGEFCLVIEGYAGDISCLSPLDLALEYVSLGLSKMDAAKRAAKETGVAKSQVYNSLIKL